MQYELKLAVYVRILCALKKDEPMQASQAYVLPEIASQPDCLIWQHGPLRRELDARGLPGDRKDQSLNDISQVHARYMASLLEVNARALMFDWSSPADTAIYAVKRTSTESSAAGYSPALTGQWRCLKHVQVCHCVTYVTMCVTLHLVSRLSSIPMGQKQGHCAHGAAGEIGYNLLKVKARGWAAGSPLEKIRRGPGAGSSRRCPARPPHHGGGALPGSRKRQQSSQDGE